jgi:pimeloyl-ACP methyl ester carboxylesterase
MKCAKTLDTGKSCNVTAKRNTGTFSLSFYVLLSEPETMNKSIMTLLLAGTLSCSETSVEKKVAPEKPTFFIAADSVNTIKANELQQLAGIAGQQKISELVKYDVRTYRITYRTTFQEETIDASGLIYIPAGVSTAMPLISLQHGTTFKKSDAPSASSKFTGMEYFASAGYISLMPDFIGYGASSDIFHPYYDRESSAGCVIDFIHAAKEFLTKENVRFNSDLFLAGYSEGGYVTLAAAHEIETNPSYKLTLKGVAAGAGGYDLSQMLTSITSTDYYSYPAYLAFVIMAYNNTYSWDLPTSDFFQPVYAQHLDNMMTGEFDGWQINSKLSTQIRSLLNTEFYQGLKDKSDNRLLEALNKNSINGWRTNVPMRLYHGMKDEIIPVSNSQNTLEEFHANGSTQVTLRTFSGGTHGNSFIPMLQDFVPWFETLRTQ